MTYQYYFILSLLILSALPLFLVFKVLATKTLGLLYSEEGEEEQEDISKQEEILSTYSKYDSASAKIDRCLRKCSFIDKELKECKILLLTPKEGPKYYYRGKAKEENSDNSRPPSFTLTTSSQGTLTTNYGSGGNFTLSDDASKKAAAARSNLGSGFHLSELPWSLEDTEGKVGYVDNRGNFIDDERLRQL